MTVRGFALVSACFGVCLLAVSCDETVEDHTVPIDELETETISVVCDAMFSCKCDQGTRYLSHDECATAARERVQALRADGEAAGLQYDPSCIGGFLNEIDAAGCDSSVENEPSDCNVPCNPYHGRRRAGQSCEFFANGMHDCDQGLSCNGVPEMAGLVCERPCEDNPNLAGIGQSCNERPCVQGAWQEFDPDFGNCTCRALPEAGEDCGDSRACADDIFCDRPDPLVAEFVCAAPVSNGEPCRGHAMCTSGFCPAGFCDDLPKVGDSCAGIGFCGRGNDCIEDRCVAGDAVVCDASVPF